MYQFEGYTLDVAHSSLRAGDRQIPLRPKSFEVLRYLVENADRLATKDELIKAVWPNVIVTDDALMHCVSEARQAIADSRQTLIATVPRRGYRFTAPVLRLGAHAAAAAPAPLVGEGEQGRVGASLDRPCVAVLPFANLSGDPQQDYFSDGITEDITTELSRFSELMVIACNSAFQYKGRAVDIRQVGRELGARYVLEGSVRRSGGRIRITAQLIDAMTGAHRWGERYDRELHDVFAVQDEIGRTIVVILAAHVNRAEIERALLKPPAAWEAYDYYLRGSEAYFFSHLTKRTKGALHEARRLLERSLAIDPDYARAAATLAATYRHAYFEQSDGDYLNPAALDRALEWAEMAVRLDARLPLARAALGDVLLFKRQHDAAIAQFECALALNPNFVDYRYGAVLAFAGEPARAIEVLEANIRLDPFQSNVPGFMGVKAWANYMLKHYGEAVRLFRECVLRLPNAVGPRAGLAAACAQLGGYEEARKEAAEVLRIYPDFTIESWKRTLPWRDPKDFEHFIDGLRKTGFPET